MITTFYHNGLSLTLGTKEFTIGIFEQFDITSWWSVDTILTYIEKIFKGTAGIKLQAMLKINKNYLDQNSVIHCNLGDTEKVPHAEF